MAYLVILMRNNEQHSSIQKVKKKNTKTLGISLQRNNVHFTNVYKNDDIVLKETMMTLKTELRQLSMAQGVSSLGVAILKEAHVYASLYSIVT